MFERKLKEIEDECWADEPSLLFLTCDEQLLRQENKRRKREGQEALLYLHNFRKHIAVSVPYKNTRSTKPYHYYNLRAYIHAKYSPILAIGCEADDLLAVYQDKEGLSTIICTRDKDLRQVPGMHYSWECGNQAGWGPTRVDELGELQLNAKKTKLWGTGLKFFFSQVITGDKVDTIPGLPKGGPVLAYKLLSACTTEEEMYEAVSQAYEEKAGEGWEIYLKEQIDLLWMVREFKEAWPVMYEPPTTEEKT